jgi:hypothetical protein
MTISVRSQPTARLCAMQRAITILSLFMGLGCASSHQRDWYDIDDPVMAIHDDAATGRLATSATTYTSYQSGLDITVVAVTVDGDQGYYSRIHDMADATAAAIQSSDTQGLVVSAKARRCDANHILEEIDKLVADGAIQTLTVVCDPDLASKLSVELPEELGYKPQRVQWLTARKR